MECAIANKPRLIAAPCMVKALSEGSEREFYGLLRTHLYAN